MGTTAAETAREVEETRRRLEGKVAQLTDRAPQEVDKMVRDVTKRLLFAVITAVAVMLVRKVVDVAWERATGDLPPTKVKRERV